MPSFLFATSGGETLYIVVANGSVGPVPFLSNWERGHTHAQFRVRTPPQKKKPVYLKEGLLEITNPRDLRRVWMCTPAQQSAKRMTWAWQMGEEANLQSCRPALQQSLSVHTKTQTTKQHLENVYIIFLLLQHNGKYTQDNLKSHFQKHILENHTNKYVKTIYRKVPSPETSP